MDGVMYPSVEQAVGRDRVRKALARYENQPTDKHEYGLVRSVNADSSYEVLLPGNVNTTRCSAFCTALVGDVVEVVIKANGKCDAIGRLGGDLGGGGSSTVQYDDVSNYIAGRVFAYAGTDEPFGCLPCDGRAVSRSTYWELFAAIGTTYGAGDGSSTFNLPNIESRTIIGEGTGESGTEYALGATGGEEKHTLTADELPTHRHEITAYSATGNDKSHIDNISYNYQSASTGWSGYTSHNGGDQPHNNMQPYIVMRYFITTGKGDPVSGINPADYVVEWGNTNGWRWEKYASGKAECWGRFATKTTEPSAWGSLYEIARLNSQPYPFEFAEVPIEDATARMYGYYISGVETSPKNLRTKTESGVYVALRPTTCPSDQSIDFELHAVGKWKDSPESGGTESIAPTIEARFEKIEPVVLYDNASGTNGTVALSESAENFEYLEVYAYCGNSKRSTSVKVASPNGKTAVLFIPWGSASANWEYRGAWAISGTTMTCSVNHTYNPGTSATASAATNEMYVYRVVGYR